MSNRQTPMYVKVAATTSIVGSAISALGWFIFVVPFITSVVLHSPFSLGGNVALGIYSALSAFALIVYIRFSLIMAGCIVDSIRMTPRTIIFVAFALCQLILTVVVLVELGKSVPWHVNGKGAISNHSEKEMKPYWVCMLVGSLWMLLCSAMSVCFAALTAVLAEHHRRQSHYLVIQ